MVKNKKGQIEIDTILGLSFMILGFFTSLIIFLGFVLKNSDFLFIGSIIMGLISILVAVLDKVMLK